MCIQRQSLHSGTDLGWCLLIPLYMCWSNERTLQMSRKVKYDSMRTYACNLWNSYLDLQITDYILYGAAILLIKENLFICLLLLFRCPRYVNLPSYCTYQQDPNDSCCKIAKCDITKIPTPAPGTVAPQTIRPGTNGPYTNNPQTVQPGMNTGPSGSNIPVNPTSITGSRGIILLPSNSFPTVYLLKRLNKII